MKTELMENIKVGVVFGPEHPNLRPVWFIWRGRRYPIEELTYTWRVAKGKTSLLYFAVKAGDLYQLCYDSHTLRWHLEAVETEG